MLRLLSSVALAPLLACVGSSAQPSPHSHAVAPAGEGTETRTSPFELVRPASGGEVAVFHVAGTGDSLIQRGEVLWGVKSAVEACNGGTLAIRGRRTSHAQIEHDLQHRPAEPRLLVVEEPTATGAAIALFAWSRYDGFVEIWRGEGRAEQPNALTGALAEASCDALNGDRRLVRLKIRCHPKVCPGFDSLTSHVESTPARKVSQLTWWGAVSLSPTAKPYQWRVRVKGGLEYVRPLFIRNDDFRCELTIAPPTGREQGQVRPLPACR